MYSYWVLLSCRDFDCRFRGVGFGCLVAYGLRIFDTLFPGFLEDIDRSDAGRLVERRIDRALAGAVGDCGDLVIFYGDDTCHDRAPLVGFVVGHYRNVAVVLATVEHGIVVTGYGDTRDVALDGRREVTAVDAVLQREGSGDLAAMRAAIRPDTRLVWIANPNNPTGTFLPYDQLKAFVAAVPSDVLVVIDEAYNEYIPQTERVDTAAWLAEFPNLVITRTFSKIYGLAGLRVGYAMASAEVADLMNRVRQPFNCNNLAIAGAAAALEDEAFVDRSYALNRAGMEQIVCGLKRLGYAHIPSHGNFLAFNAGDAVALNQKLLKQGVIVRPIAGYGMPEWLRVTIGREGENTRFAEALERAL